VLFIVVVSPIVFVQEGLLTSPRTIGHIFNLKNNFGWKDIHTVEHQKSGFDNIIGDMGDTHEGQLVDKDDTRLMLEE